MNYLIEISTVAEEEFIEAFDWYEKRQVGLGERFAKHVEKRLEDIKRHPERYAVKKQNIRETSVSVFPFIIVYKIDIIQGKVLILHIFHAKRKPGFKYK